MEHIRTINAREIKPGMLVRVQDNLGQWFQGVIDQAQPRHDERGHWMRLVFKDLGVTVGIGMANVAYEGVEP
jgi:hypothetical protein